MDANWWEVLGCSVDSSPAEARQRFRTLAQLYHPDRWMDAPDTVRTEAAERMRQVSEAYEASKRHTARSGPAPGGQPPRPSPPPPPASGSAPRNARSPKPPAQPDRVWSPPGAGRGHRHPNGLDWLRSMEAKGRLRWTHIGAHPAAALEACRRYVQGRKGWKVVAFDAVDGMLTFAARVGVRTWKGQVVTVWLEPAAQPDTWFLLAAAESANPQLHEWNEASAALSELFERAELRKIGRY